MKPSGLLPPDDRDDQAITLRGTPTEPAPGQSLRDLSEHRVNAAMYRLKTSWLSADPVAVERDLAELKIAVEVWRDQQLRPATRHP